MSPEARVPAALGAGAALALGGASRLFPLGIAVWDKSLGDVAYAAWIGFGLLLIRPRAKPITIVLATIAICFGVELFQLSGIPARGPRVVQVLLGTSFSWHDVGCYVVGALVTGAVALRLSASRAARSASPSS